MKVLHVTYSSKGGAGIAALRLHNALQENGVKSAYLSVNLTISFENKEVDDPFFLYKKPSLLKKIGNKFLSLLPLTKRLRLKKNINNFRKQKKNIEIFSSPFSSFNIQKHPLFKKADIINLHWVSGIIDYSFFFKNCKKPIVWTLHDMNPFLGCFHYKNDDEKNKYNFKVLDKNIKLIKKRNYKKSTIRTIVAPSKWLLNESKKSDLLGGFFHKHIYNGANDNIFRAIDIEKAREVLKLPKDKIIFLFVSQNVSCYRKGFDIIEGVINKMDNREDILFVAIGKPPVNQHKKIHYLGTIKNLEIMAYAYTASNAFLLPSREDNLPNTMVESLLCGTPVISSDLGGMAEVVINDKNGYLVESLTIEGFNSQILKFIDSKDCFNKKIISLEAKNNFSKNTLSTNYSNLYKTILND